MPADAAAPVPRVLSGIQPTAGSFHLGNYLGALRNWVAGQHANAFHGIVDLHSLTVVHDPKVMHDNTVNLAMMLFAVGLDPEVTTVFVQSHVPEHSQLAWIMECTVSV
ncbi:MAG: tryptophan--tRNA ligase, partial [Actinobacteria bacterium]